MIIEIMNLVTLIFRVTKLMSVAQLWTTFENQIKIEQFILFHIIQVTLEGFPFSANYISRQIYFRVFILTL